MISTGGVTSHPLRNFNRPTDQPTDGHEGSYASCTSNNNSNPIKKKNKRNKTITKQKLNFFKCKFLRRIYNFLLYLQEWKENIDGMDIPEFFNSFAGFFILL